MARFIVGIPKTIAENTHEVSFLLRGAEFDFRAGQYIRVTLDDLARDDSKGNSRDFSIVSSPNDKEKLSVAFRDSGSGYKETLMGLPEGTEVNIDGPFGNFILPERADRPLVFVAGGIGVTPFLSMIRFATENKLAHKITLLYANTSEERASYMIEIKELAQQNGNFIFSEKIGMVDEEFIRQNLNDLAAPLWHLSGLPEMVAGVRGLLLKLGVHERDILSEEFTGYGGYGHIASSNRHELAPQNEHLYRTDRESALLEALNSTALVAETNVNGDIVYANDLFVSISKYDRDELIGQNHRILKSGHHPQSVYEDLWKTISGGHVWRGEIKNRAKDGTFYWVDSSIAPAHGENGEIERYIAIRFPITDKKLAEEKLERSAHIVDLMPSGMMTYRLDDANDDSSLVLVDCNSTAGEIMGVDLALCSGKKIDEAFPKAREGGLPHVFAEVVRNERMQDLGEVHYGDTRVRDAWYHVKAFPVPGRHVTIIFDDITEIRNANLALQKEKESIEQKVIERTEELNKSQQKIIDLLETLKLLNKILRHDILNDLTVVRGNIEMGLEYGDGKAINESLNEMMGAVKRDIAFIGQMSELERAISGGETLNPVLVRDVAQKVAQKFGEMKIGVFGEATALADQALESVLVNLVRNANVHGGVDQVDINMETDGDVVKIRVSDHGKGIPDEVKAKLFQEGYKYGATGHSGIGLYIVKKTIERYGGTASVEDNHPEGTVFVLSIPRG